MQRRMVIAIASIAFILVIPGLVAVARQPGEAVWVKLPDEQYYKPCKFIRDGKDPIDAVVNCAGREYTVTNYQLQTPTEVFKPGDRVWAAVESDSSSTFINCTVERFNPSDQYVGTYALKCDPDGKDFTVPAHRVRPDEKSRVPWSRKLLRGLIIVVLVLSVVIGWKCGDWLEPRMIGWFGNNPFSAWLWWVIVTLITCALFTPFLLFMMWFDGPR